MVLLAVREVLRQQRTKPQTKRSYETARSLQGWFGLLGDGSMKCPNCVIGDLLLLVRGDLCFQTDAKGRPYGTAEVRTMSDQIRMQCDTCQATLMVQGWKEDGSGLVILEEQEQELEGPQVEMERKTPPPGTPRID
jgi:hypothetical protein